MTDIGHPRHEGWLTRLSERFHEWRLSKVASPEFQRWAAKSWFARPFVKQDSAKIYDLVAGFVYSQTLLACTELGVLHTLRNGPRTARALAARHGLPEDRMRSLCQAACSIGLMVLLKDETYRLGRLGAAVLGVPGLEDMIRHHKVFYRDLSDPVALLKGDSDTELSRFWPYVLGEGSAEDAAVAAEYSDLMATSQHLVAEETLDAVSLVGIRALTDVGGGTGVFLEHAAHRYPDLDVTLFDLPAVISAAQERLEPEGSRINLRSGSFVADPLPDHGDAISLIRVCYDHNDSTVRELLTRVFNALPSGGRLIVSEPMSGGERPNRAGDAYFGFYTMAMTTGRPRDAARHMSLLREAGFADARQVPTRRPFLTSVVIATKA